jgi:HK97 family phage portal protein
VNLRDMFSGIDVIPLPGQGIGNWTVAGRRVTAERAEGLPSVLRGIRLYAETIGGLPLVVYRGDPQVPDLAATINTGQQFELLAKKPNGLQTTFALKAFIVASIEGFGNAYILKTKSRGRVQELWPLDPRRVVPKTEGTEISYKVSVKQGEKPVRMTRDQVLHIPGLLLTDPYIGISPIMVAANAMGKGLAIEEYGGRFYDNDATPRGILKFKGAANTQAAKDTREVWDDRHRGSKNAHRIAALFGGTEYQQVGVDAVAAQAIQAQEWSITECSNALSLPKWALGGRDENPRSTPEQRNAELLQFSIGPKLVMIEQGLHADDDLFPDKELHPYFLAEGMLRAEMLMRYQSYALGRQGGWLTSNDVRKKENMAPIEGGDELLDTPVGGAPNLQPGQGDEGNKTETPEPSEAQ